MRRKDREAGREEAGSYVQMHKASKEEGGQARRRGRGVRKRE